MIRVLEKILECHMTKEVAHIELYQYNKLFSKYNDKCTTVNFKATFS